MKHKVSELTGGLLDALVAMVQDKATKITDGRAYILVPYDDGSQINSGRTEWIYFAPSSQWNDGGPIIEGELIELVVFSQPGDDDEEMVWSAYYTESASGQEPPDGRGPTPLIAAMRAFVVGKLGEEVEFP